MGPLVLLALGTFLSEDAALLSAGVLVANGQLSFAAVTLACIAGIVIGDVLLYLAGSLAAPLSRRWVGAERLDRAARWLGERGASVVLLSRFTPGLRLPTYLAAGVVGAGLGRFTLWFLVAAAVWTPLVIGAATFREGLWIAGGAVAVRLLPWRLRRRLWGRVQRIWRWEFWPMWAMYLPLVPYLLWLAVRHRSFTVFCKANPGIPHGGFVGESKRAILEQLDPSKVAPLLATPEYPMVLKPDVGERGKQVAIIRTPEERQRYLDAARGDVIAQRYIPGVEYGVFYYRYPGAFRGHISSITEKRFPTVVGDGRRTLRDLILADDRAVCLAGAYFARARQPLDAVPAEGEPVPLVEIGSHSKGSVFLDGMRDYTDAMHDAIEEALRPFPGFHFGRFDIRAATRAAFQAGDFSIVELNGVTAEPAHIYDPAVSLLQAYRTMAQHWRMAFRIGSAVMTQQARCRRVL